MKKAFSLLLLSFLFCTKIVLAAQSDGFDYPVGKPDGVGYYDAQNFGEWNDGFRGFHLGEDWNKKCSGDCDSGDFVYAISDGIVRMSQNKGLVWGRVVIIEHQLPGGEKYYSQYGHLNEQGAIELNSQVVRGQTIGTIRNGIKTNFGYMYAHLHFELRDDSNPQKISEGFGYSKTFKPAGWVDPSAFIDAHRPTQRQTLTASSPESGKIKLDWTKSESDQFARYELYRSTIQGGTDDPNSRVLVVKTEDVNTLTYTDTTVSSGTTYYYRLFTYFKSGLWAKSDEVSIDLKRVIIPITNEKGSAQTKPVISDGVIYWEDLRSEGGTWPRKLYWYVIASMESGSTVVGNIINGLQRPLVPQAAGNRVVFQANDKLYSGSNIYMHDFNTGSTIPITTYLNEQMTPSISADGVIVWTDLRNGKDLDLYYLDVRDARGEVPFVIQPGNQRCPKIWDNKVIWKDSRAGNRHDLYMKEIGSDTETLLAVNVGEGVPDIWENWAVWDYKGVVSLINLSTKEVKIIADKNGGAAKVRDNKVVYTLTGEKDANGNPVAYVHVYDILTGKITKIDYPLYYGSSPYIYGNYIAFDASVKMTIPDMEIYLTEI